ncbi:protein disulfide-isomerase [Clonorchis sinensis]|uniref:Protein disulfide-isomerase n=1 Tax=Clonorchis sinensis TaxID=79923 RepID=G7YI63_CLOSI|nr:protein disulfide-isomerase [Clonorchis sinensis]
MNRPRKGDAAGTRTAAHEMDGGHVNHYATAPAPSLPKIEIDKFSGNPMEFWKFMKAFQMSIADRLFDDSNKLMYLLHYCRGEAKEAIEHCVFLPGKTGYQKAMDILRTQFGRPHDIAQSFMNKLLVGGPITPGDVDALRRLIRKMVNCDLALKQMHYTADLNCSTNLKRIVERLPRHLQQSWAEVADDILRSGSEPEFDHLVSFLDRSVSIASNCYGVIASPRRYDVARQLGIEWEATRAEVSSVNGPDIKDTMAVTFAIQSLHDGYAVDVDCAYTIESLPITKASIPDELLLKKWAHLADVQPARIPGDTVLI